LEVPDNKGNIIKRKVTKKWLDKMIASDKASIIDKAFVLAHILDPLVSEPIIENWEIDVDISRESVDQSKDKSGDIYILNSYTEGKPARMIVRKDIWDDVLIQMNEQ